MINMFSLQNQVWGITFYIFFQRGCSPFQKNLPIPPPFLQNLHKEVLGCGCRGPTTSAEHVGCERVEIIIVIIITMKKGLYPLSGVSMGGGWWWCSVSCWVVPTRGGPTTDVGADLLGQPWKGRDFSKPFLGRNNILPWPAGNSPSHATRHFCRDSMAWAGGGVGFGGENEVWFALGAVEKEPCGALWPGSNSSSSPPCPVFWGGGKGSRTTWVTWLRSYWNQHRVFMAFKVKTPLQGIFGTASPGVQKLEGSPTALKLGCRLLFWMFPPMWSLTTTSLFSCSSWTPGKTAGLGFFPLSLWLYL